MDIDERSRKLAEDIAAERGMTLEEARAATVPMRQVCVGCGKERSIPSNATSTPCSCGAAVATTETLLGVVAPE